MSFEWVEQKNLENIRKHGISFERAQTIYDGPVFTGASSRQDFGEKRFISYGLLDEIVIAVVLPQGGMLAD
jgi:hypothetical protein